MTTRSPTHLPPASPPPHTHPWDALYRKGGMEGGTVKAPWREEPLSVLQLTSWGFDRRARSGSCQWREANEPRGCWPRAWTRPHTQGADIGSLSFSVSWLIWIWTIFLNVLVYLVRYHKTKVHKIFPSLLPFTWCKSPNIDDEKVRHGRWH